MTEPLRLLHAHSGNLFGGVESALVALSRVEQESLAPESRSDFLLCFEGRFEHELRALHARVVLAPQVRLSRPWTVRAARAVLAEQLDTNRYDALVLHSSWSLSVFARAANLRALPVVLQVHGPIDRRHWLQRISGLLGHADFAIPNSKYTAAASSRFLRSLPFQTVYCPVPQPPLAPPAARDNTRNELGIRTDEVVIVQVSRMESWKGHALHIEALSQLLDLPNWSVLFVGGPQREEERRYEKFLRRRVEQLGLTARVRFLGQRTDVSQLLSASDLHCQPNEGPEPFGITFIEALQHGLPVVTTRLGAAPEIVTRDCGLLVEPGDSVALASALRTLILDSSKRTHLSRAGPSRALELCGAQQQSHRFAAAIRSFVTTSASRESEGQLTS